MADETEDEIPKPRDEITLRDHERRKLSDVLPEIVEMYHDVGLDERADDLESIQGTFGTAIDGHETTYDLGADDWELLSTALSELDRTDTEWLRAKIARRAELSVVHMGFVSTVPPMSFAVGTDPVHPDRS